VSGRGESGSIDEGDATLPLPPDVTVPSRRDTTVHSGRRTAAHGSADEETVVVARASSLSAGTAAPATRHLASIPRPEGLRTPYPARHAPVVPRRAPAAASPSGAPVDAAAIAHGIRVKAHRRAVLVAAAAASVVLAATTLLVLTLGAA
jgi:hypothetical protein